MMAHTETAVLAILRADPSVTPETIRAGMDALKGKTAAGFAVDAPTDRALTRRQAAEILGVKPHTVSDYARKGLIVPFRFGADRKRACGYSAESVKRLMEQSGKRGAA